MHVLYKLFGEKCPEVYMGGKHLIHVQKRIMGILPFYVFIFLRTKDIAGPKGIKTEEI